MLDRIVMNVIEVTIHIPPVAYDMVPEPALPDRTPVHALAGETQVRKGQLNPADNAGQICFAGVNDRVEVIRQYYPGEQLESNSGLNARDALH